MIGGCFLYNSGIAARKITALPVVNRLSPRKRGGLVGVGASYTLATIAVLLYSHIK